MLIAYVLLILKRLGRTIARVCVRACVRVRVCLCVCCVCVVVSYGIVLPIHRVMYKYKTFNSISSFLIW